MYEPFKPTGSTSTAIDVPAAVPSVFHSSFPWTPSFATNHNSPLLIMNDSGLLLADASLPALMFLRS